MNRGSNLTKRATSEIAKTVERPNVIMLRPKPATLIIRIGPAWRLGGRRVATSITSRAPIEGAVRRTPRPAGPTCRMSTAKIGRSAIAPPKKTAKRSSAIEPRSAGVRIT